MSVIAVPVIDARALLDEDKGLVTIEVRLANGQELRVSSSPSPEVLAEVREALTTPAPEPVKPTRRSQSRRKKKEDPPS